MHTTKPFAKRQSEKRHYRLNWEKQRIEADIEAAKAKAEDVKNNYIPSALHQ